MATPTYTEMLVTAIAELSDAQSMSQFSANGTTINKQTIADLQKHIQWLEWQISKEALGPTTGFVEVINI